MRWGCTIECGPFFCVVGQYEIYLLKIWQSNTEGKKL